MVEDTIPWEEVFVSLAFLFISFLPVYTSLYVTDRRKEKNGDFLFALVCAWVSLLEVVGLGIEARNRRWCEATRLASRSTVFEFAYDGAVDGELGSDEDGDEHLSDNRNRFSGLGLRSCCLHRTRLAFIAACFIRMVGSGQVEGGTSGYLGDIGAGLWDVRSSVMPEGMRPCAGPSSGTGSLEG